MLLYVNQASFPIRVFHCESCSQVSYELQVMLSLRLLIRFQIRSSDSNDIRGINSESTVIDLSLGSFLRTPFRLSWKPPAVVLDIEYLANSLLQLLPWKFRLRITNVCLSQMSSICIKANVLCLVRYVDLILLPIFPDIISSLAASETPGICEIVVKHALPPRSQPLNWLAVWLKPLLPPNLFECLSQVEHRDVVQNGISCCTQALGMAGGIRPQRSRACLATGSEDSTS